MSSPTAAELIPWEWSVTPLSSSNRQCPPPSVILGTFAGINVVASVLSLFFGCEAISRRITRFLTCGCFGRKGEDSSREWRYMWIGPFVLSMGANAINAWITVSADGYDQTSLPKVWDLMLFYTTRPRISWIVLSTLSYYRAEEKKDGPWTLAGREAAISEALLVIIGSYYMGRTANFGTKKGYYLAHHTSFELGLNLRLLIVGALLYLIWTITTFIVLMTHCFNLDKRLKIQSRSFPFTIASISWIASWLYMAGYVRLAGQLYCPPSFLAQGIVWVGFAAIGSFLGGGI